LARASVDVENERLVLMPTRALPRKNVAGALELCEEIDAVLWLLGPAEDGYDQELEALLASSPVDVRRGPREGLDVHDAYAACDLVVMPSTWEGFGNPVLESVTHRRPLAVYPYPVAREIMAYGFHFFDLADVDDITNYLSSPDLELLANNLTIAEAHFNITALPGRLRSRSWERWESRRQLSSNDMVIQDDRPPAHRATRTVVARGDVDLRRAGISIGHHG
jgi:glycosyltransferase involved in cell wall biosynthesis